MALPAFATVPELALRIPGGIAAEDEMRAYAALQDASALVRAEAGKTWVDDSNALSGVPDAIPAIVMAVARRVLFNPDGVASESVPDYSRTFVPSSTNSDVYLTRGEKRVIRSVSGKSGLWTLATTRAGIGGDVPAVTSGGYTIDPPREEYDPFFEGWSG